MNSKHAQLVFPDPEKGNTDEGLTLRLVMLPNYLVVMSRLVLFFGVTVAAVLGVSRFTRVLGNPWSEIRMSLPRVALVCGAGALLLVTAEVITRKWHAPAEYARKVAHVGACAIALLVPTLFATHWAVFIIAIIFSIALMLSHRFGGLSCLHFPASRSKGAILLLWAVYLVFLLSEGNRLLFQVPVLVLAVGDTAGALIGQRYGRIRYQIHNNTRTLEGSLAFVVSSFLFVLFFFAEVTEMSLAHSALLSLLISTVAGVAEAVTPAGFDNVTIPVAVLLLLGACL